MRYGEEEEVVGWKKFCVPRKDEAVPFAGEEQLNVSPTVALLDGGDRK
jgi:hypothetical protein